jgi:hypothetical protein
LNSLGLRGLSRLQSGDLLEEYLRLKDMSALCPQISLSMQLNKEQSFHQQVTFSQQTEQSYPRKQLRVVVSRSQLNSPTLRRSTTAQLQRSFASLLKTRLEVKPARIIFFDQELSNLQGQYRVQAMPRPPKLKHVPRSVHSTTTSLTNLHKLSLTAYKISVEDCPLKISSVPSTAYLHDVTGNSSTFYTQPKRKAAVTRPVRTSKQRYHQRLQKDPVLERTSNGQYVYIDSYERDASLVNKPKSSVLRAGLRKLPSKSFYA